MSTMSEFRAGFLPTLRGGGGGGGGSEAAMLMLCLLSLVGSKVDSRSTADDLLSETETTDSEPILHPPLRLIVDDVDDDVDADDDDIIASVAKRSPWTPYEVNVDNLRQNIIRSKTFSNRQKHSSPSHLEHAPGSTWEEEKEGEEEQAYSDGYVAGWSQAVAYLEETGLIRASPEDIALVSRRFAEQRRGGSRVHPVVHRGMGQQETASASIGPFVAPWAAAEEERRNAFDAYAVRFIGNRRRHAADE